MTETVAAGKAPRGFPADHLKRALEQAHHAGMTGYRDGQIRINDQWRICFVWTEAGPEQVEIADYH